MKFSVFNAFAASALFSITLSAGAQAAFPNKPIRIINPYAAGGASDAISRSVGDRLTRILNQPVIVENRSGASGMIGATACKQAPADGYTYCILLSDILVINPHIYKNIAYDANKDFEAVINLASVDSLVVVRSGLPVKNMDEFTKHARANPAKLSWGSVGMGSSPHLIMEKVAAISKLDISHVPYQGTTPAVMAMLGGQIDATMTAFGVANPYLQDKKLTALAVLGDKRLTALPDVPTLSEQGIPFTGQLWQGLFAPKGTPAAAITVVNRAINQVLADPEFVKQNLTSKGYTPVGGPAADLTKRVAIDSVGWGDLAKSLNLKLD